MSGECGYRLLRIAGQLPRFCALVGINGARPAIDKRRGRWLEGRVPHAGEVAEWLKAAVC